MPRKSHRRRARRIEKPHAFDAQARDLDYLARIGRLDPPRNPLGPDLTAGPLTGATAGAYATAAAAAAGSHVTAEPSGLLVARFRPIPPLKSPPR